MIGILHSYFVLSCFHFLCIVLSKQYRSDYYTNYDSIGNDLLYSLHIPKSKHHNTSTYVNIAKLTSSYIFYLNIQKKELCHTPIPIPC